VADASPPGKSGQESSKNIVKANEDAPRTPSPPIPNLPHIAAKPVEVVAKVFQPLVLILVHVAAHALLLWCWFIVVKLLDDWTKGSREWEWVVGHTVAAFLAPIFLLVVLQADIRILWIEQEERINQRRFEVKKARRTRQQQLQELERKHPLNSRKDQAAVAVESKKELANDS